MVPHADHSNRPIRVHEPCNMLSSFVGFDSIITQANANIAEIASILSFGSALFHASSCAGMPEAIDGGAIQLIFAYFVGELDPQATVRMFHTNGTQFLFRFSSTSDRITDAMRVMNTADPAAWTSWWDVTEATVPPCRDHCPLSHLHRSLTIFRLVSAPPKKTKKNPQLGCPGSDCCNCTEQIPRARCAAALRRPSDGQHGLQADHAALSSRSARHHRGAGGAATDVADGVADGLRQLRDLPSTQATPSAVRIGDNSGGKLPRGLYPSGGS